MKTLRENLDRLEHLESVIEAGRSSWIRAGEALIEIRDEELYLNRCDTFWQYCEQRWGWQKRNVNTVIESFNAFKQLGDGGQNFAHSASAAREAAKIPADKRPEVLALAGEKPTAAAIRKAHKTTLAEASEPTSRPEPEQPAALKGIDVSKLDGAKVIETDRPEFFANDFESICDAVIADGNDKQLAAAILAAEVAIKKMRHESNRRRSQQ